MNRRGFLTAVAGGSMGSMAGCSSIFEESGPFHFGITNWRETEYTAEVKLTKNDDEELINGRFDITGNDPTREEPPGIYLESVTTVKNGDTINARVILNGETYRGNYEVTCNQRDNSANNFFLYIHSGDGEIEFGGSRCGV